MTTKKNAVAQALVAMRNKKLTPERRKEIAAKAAQARWGKGRKKARSTKAAGQGDKAE